MAVHPSPPDIVRQEDVVSDETVTRKFPPQEQERQPGVEGEMEPRPDSEDEGRRPSGKLSGRRALITGGDSGIGRAVAIAFAREGADVAIVYLDEHDDARETKRRVEEKGAACVTIAGDIGDAEFCREAVARAVEALGAWTCWSTTPPSSTCSSH